MIESRSNNWPKQLQEYLVHDTDHMQHIISETKSDSPDSTTDEAT